MAEPRPPPTVLPGNTADDGPGTGAYNPISAAFDHHRADRFHRAKLNRLHLTRFAGAVGIAGEALLRTAPQHRCGYHDQTDRRFESFHHFSLHIQRIRKIN